MPNFVLLDTSRPDIAHLLVAMLQAVDRRSWSHPQESTGEDWWADVLADPRARKRKRRDQSAVKQAVYRLSDEQQSTILVECSKCDWKAAYGRDELIASHGAEYPLPSLLNELAKSGCTRLSNQWDCPLLLAWAAGAQDHRFEDDPIVAVRENFVACDVLSQLQRVMGNPRFLLAGECEPLRAGDQVRVYARRGPYFCIYPHDRTSPCKWTHEKALSK